MSSTTVYGNKVLRSAALVLILTCGSRAKADSLWSQTEMAAREVANNATDAANSTLERAANALKNTLRDPICDDVRKYGSSVSVALEVAKTRAPARLAPILLALQVTITAADLFCSAIN